MPITEEQLAFRRRGAAKALDVSEDTLDRLIRRGELRVIRIGGAVCISREELMRYIAAREAEAAP